MSDGAAKTLDPLGSKIRRDNPDPMGKAGPDAPDYLGAAEATAQASKDINTDQTFANRANTTTPWGSQTWTPSVTKDPATGRDVTTWSQNIQLGKDQQSALDSQNQVQLGRSQTAEGLLGQATDAFKTPMDWNSLPQGGQSASATSVDPSSHQFGQGPQSQQMQTSLNGDSSAYRQRAQDAVDELNAPALKDQRNAMEARLAAQGITSGSEAYNTEARNQGDNESRAHLMAIQAGQSEANQMFNQDLSAGNFGNQARAGQYAQDLTGSQYDNSVRAQDTQENLQRATTNLGNQVQAGSYNNTLRNQKIAELAQKRGMPLNELNALLTGQQVNMPGFNTSTPQAGKSTGTDYTGAMTDSYNAQVSQSNADNAQKSGMASAGLAAALAFY